MTVAAEVGLMEASIKVELEDEDEESEESHLRVIMFQCQFCCKDFSKKSNLKRHLEKVHNIPQSSPIRCSLCDQDFPQKIHVTRHMENVHNIPQQKSSVKCRICSKSFYKKSNVKKHLQTVHKIPQIPSDTSSMTKCVVDGCGATFYKYRDMVAHLNEVHSMGAEIQHTVLPDNEAFKEFKEELEIKTCTRFVLYKGTSTSKLRVYVCNRRGNYRGIGAVNRKRRLKSMGSCKTGKPCLARLTVNVEDDGQVHVEYVLMHTNHDVSLCHLRYTEREKNALISKVMSGLPIKNILKDIRCTISDASDVATRLDITSRKDLYNVCVSVGLDKDSRHKNSSQSIDAIIEDLYRRESFEVLLYRGPDMKTEDSECDALALAVTTKFQLKAFQRLGLRLVCLDTTQSAASSEFRLTTILVTDEWGSAMPVAWLISNIESEDIVFKFLSEFRLATERVADEFPSTTHFISDSQPDYYKMWCSATGTEPRRLLCAWHIHKAWITNLYLIKDSALRKEVYQTLSSVMKLTEDTEVKSTMLRFLTRMASNEELKSFIKYFTQLWVPMFDDWIAKDHYNRIDTSLFMESFQQHFRYPYLDGRTVKRMDRCIGRLVDFASDIVIERNIKIERELPAWKDQQCEQRHNSVSIYSVHPLSDNMWEVCSDSSTNIYWCVSAVENPSCVDCKLFCEDCGVCAHEYLCSCSDHIFKGALCEHIHSVASFVKQEIFSDPDDTVETVITEVSEDHTVDPSVFLKAKIVDTLEDMANSAVQQSDIEILEEASGKLTDVCNLLDVKVEGEKRDLPRQFYLIIKKKKS